MRILCVTRAYPPVVGGMERLSFEFTQALAEKARVLLVANRRGKSALPWFLPYAAVKLRQLAPEADVIHLGDPLLTCLFPFLPNGDREHMRPPAPFPVSSGPGAPSGQGSAPGGAESEERSAVRMSRWDIRTAVSRQGGAESGRKRPTVAVTIHGLDILYQNPLYQALLRRFLPRVDLGLCISRFVESEVRRRFPALRTALLTPGVRATPYAGNATRADLERFLKTPLGHGPLLLTVARLVRRKGIAWFAECVLPAIPDGHLLVVGDGPERATILRAAERAGTRERLTLGGRVHPSALALAYQTADLLVMPNIRVPGDAEGFGLVAVEAAAAGLPVAASRLEGIPDAVVEGETGILLPPGDAAIWTKEITRLLADAEERGRLAARAPVAARGRYAWGGIADRAMALFVDLARDSPGRPPLDAHRRAR